MKKILLVTAILALFGIANVPYVSALSDTKSYVTDSGLNDGPFSDSASQANSNAAANYSTPVKVAASATGATACASLATTGLAGVVKCIIGILDNLTVLIIAASVVYIMWGAFQMIRSEEKREAGRQTVIYGVIGLFAMISIWGFVNILNSTFRLKTDYIPAPTFHQ